MAKRKKAFGSPIETMLRNGIVEAAAAHRIYLCDFSVFAGSPVIARDPRSCAVVVNNAPEEYEPWGDENGQTLSLYSGVSIRSYKIDLLLELAGSCAVLAIECDGHEWHDRTKQQAAYDRARDRELLSLNIPTIRFTGSEIHHSLDRCVSDVYAVVGSIDEACGQQILSWRAGLEAGQQRARDEMAQLAEEHW